MFSGEESIRMADQGGDDKTFDLIESELASLGRVKVSDRGRMSVYPKSSFDGTLTKVTMEGSVRQRKNGEYEVLVNYTCTLNTLGWVILVLGILFLLIGIAVLIAPAMQKNEVGRKVARTLQNLE
jgi:hypothetical protein